MNDCIQAWNRAAPEAVASFYTDDLDYRDPSVPAGIASKEEFIKYLKVMFHVWPHQEWVPGEFFPHNKDGSLSGCYRFKIAHQNTEICGHAIDIIEFKGNKISRNYVYLNADKWNKWLKSEISGGRG